MRCRSWKSGSTKLNKNGCKSVEVPSGATTSMCRQREALPYPIEENRIL